MSEARQSPGDGQLSETRATKKSLLEKRDRGRSTNGSLDKVQPTLKVDRTRSIKFLENYSSSAVIARPSGSEANRAVAISRNEAAKEMEAHVLAFVREITASWGNTPTPRNDKVG